MYYVTFSTPDALDAIVRVFCHQAIEPCLEFALALHRSSNYFHTVSVFREDDCLVSLVLKENHTEKKS